jgi:hypothetical protein
LKAHGNQPDLTSRMRPRDDACHAHVMTGVSDVADPNGVRRCRN